MSLTKQEAVELFEIRARGAVAGAFSHAEISPNKDQWEALHGLREMTLREMGEISFVTDVEFSLALHDRRSQSDETE